MTPELCLALGRPCWCHQLTAAEQGPSGGRRRAWASLGAVLGASSPPCTSKSSLEKGMDQEKGVDQLALPSPRWSPGAGWADRSRTSLSKTMDPPQLLQLCPQAQNESWQFFGPSVSNSIVLIPQG